jgi:hypothetical protein
MPLNRQPGDEEGPGVSRNPEEARGKIRDYLGRSRRGQWGVFAFLCLSMAAFRFGPLLARLPEDVRGTLGSAPPVQLMNIALAVYAFAALVYILARMMEGDSAYRGWSHLGYLGGFYFFYAYAGALRENFWAILVAGVTIFGLEHFRHWQACREAIRRERQALAEFDRHSRNL